MNSKGQKQHERSAKDQPDARSEGRRHAWEAANPQPKDTPMKKVPASPDDDNQEDRSNLADIGEADEQDGAVEGMKKGSAQQDPPATLPQELRHERRHNM